MAIPLRRADPENIIAGLRTFFLTSSIAGKRKPAAVAPAVQRFIDALYHYRSQDKFLLHDFVIMPDHFLTRLPAAGVLLFAVTGWTAQLGRARTGSPAP